MIPLPKKTPAQLHADLEQLVGSALLCADILDSIAGSDPEVSGAVQNFHNALGAFFTPVTPFP